jgi:hypothetical protein
MIYTDALLKQIVHSRGKIPFKRPQKKSPGPRILDFRQTRTDGFDWVINLELDHFFFAPFLRQTIADHTNLMLQDVSVFCT